MWSPNTLCIVHHAPLFTTHTTHRVMKQEYHKLFWTFSPLSLQYGTKNKFEQKISNCKTKLNFFCLFHMELEVLQKYSSIWTQDNGGQKFYCFNNSNFHFFCLLILFSSLCNNLCIFFPSVLGLSLWAIKQIFNSPAEATELIWYGS